MTQLLNRLRTTAALAAGQSPEAPQAGQRADFAALLKQSLNQVSEMQSASSELSTRFEAGDSQVNIEDVMIAREKASLSFQAMMQVRNKLVAAYQEIMTMQV
jgi:flagellar hook-basal body complex protein FliE